VHESFDTVVGNIAHGHPHRLGDRPAPADRVGYEADAAFWRAFPDARLVTIDDGHLFLVASAGESTAEISRFLG
jgi:hypothetical protein